MEKVINKPNIVVAALVGTILPWLTGGREPVALVVSFGLVVISSFLMWRMPERSTLRRDPLVWAGGGLLVWSVFSMFWSVNRYQSMSWLVSWTLVTAIFALAHSMRGNAGLRWKWLLGYLGVASVFSIYGVYLYLTGEYERLTSTFYWANPYAAYIMPAVIIAGWFFVRGRKFEMRWALPLVINGVAFGLTFSRGAMLVLALVSVLAVAMSRPKIYHWVKIVFSLFCVIGLVALLTLARQQLFKTGVVDVSSRFAEAASGESTSLSDRLNYLRSAVDIWKSKPGEGYGGGTFATLHPQYQQRVISASADVHNAYLQRLPELGIIGFLLLSLSMVLLLLGVGRSWRKQPELRPYIIGLMGLLIHAGLDIDARYPAFMALAAIFAGICYRPVRTEVRKPSGIILALLVILAIPVFGAYRSAAYARIGQAFQDNHEFDTAAYWYNRAHKLINYDPDTVSAEGINYYTLARLGVEPKTNAEIAGARARQAMQLDPRDAQHVFLLARVLRQEGDVRGAEIAYKRAIELDEFNHPEYYVDLADLYISNNAPNEGKLYATKAIDLYPVAVLANRSAQADLAVNVASAYGERAAAEFNLGDPAAARRDIAQALKIDPGNVVTLKVQKELDR